MENYIEYILKSGICLSIFLVIYILFLRRTTFFKFNRTFLLVGMVASLIIPALKYTYDVVVSVTLLPTAASNEAISPAAPSSSSVSILAIILGIYVLGIAAVFFRNIYTYAKISKLLTNGTRTQYKGMTLVENASIASPFSFFNYIVMNTNNMSQTEQNLIITHEATHVNQKHWVDLLLSECLLMLQWFNPIVWYYIHLLKENHEFLADKAVLESGVSPAVYQAALINQEFQGPVFSFSNSFNYLKPLNRLKMMKKNESAAWKRLAALAIFPLFGLFLWASAEPNYIVEYQYVNPIAEDELVDDDTIRIQVTDISSADKKSEPVTIHVKPINESEADKKDTIFLTQKSNGAKFYYMQKGNSEKPDIIDEMLPGSGATREILSTKNTIIFDGNQGTPLVIIDGEKVPAESMKNLKPEEIDNISVLKDGTSTAVYGDEGKMGVILIYTKKYVEQHPEKKSQKGTTDVKVFNFDSDTKGKFKLDAEGKKGKAESTFVIVNGTHESASKLISSVSKPISYPSMPAESLYIINGKEASASVARALEQSKIKSITVLKDKIAIEKYGEKGKDGVIIIETE